MVRELNEPILEDDYPVYASYFYIADGKPIMSDIEGTVARLKQDIGAKEIRRCDFITRGKDGMKGCFDKR